MLSILCGSFQIFNHLKFNHVKSGFNSPSAHRGIRNSHEGLWRHFDEFFLQLIALLTLLDWMQKASIWFFPVSGLVCNLKTGQSALSQVDRVSLANMKKLLWYIITFYKMFFFLSYIFGLISKKNYVFFQLFTKKRWIDPVHPSALLKQDYLHKNHSNGLLQFICFHFLEAVNIGGFFSTLYQLFRFIWFTKVQKTL